MQIPYSDYSKIQMNGDLQQIESRYRGNIKTTDREEAGLRTARSRSVSGPHPYVDRDTAEVFCFRIHGIFKK